MTKMIKMSLVAAMAVAGISSTVAAKPLSSAIENTTIGGMIRYREGFKNIDNGASTEQQQAKMVVGLKSKVNDKVTASVKFVGVLNQKDSVTKGAPGLDVAKFTYANGKGCTLTAGLMELATPWTDAADGARANGLLATKAVNGITFAAAILRDSTMGADKTVGIDANDITAVAAIGKAGSVSYQAWYATIGNGDAGLNAAGKPKANALPSGGDAVALVASAKVGPAAVNASYASLEGDNNTLKKQTLIKAVASAKAGSATVVAGFAKGGSDGDLVTFDQDAKVGFESWNIRAGGAGQYDLSAYTVAAVAPVNGIALKAQYTGASFDNGTAATAGDTDVTELLLQASYKMSKNFGGYLRYASVDQDAKATSTSATVNTKFNRTRLEIKYTF